MYVSLNQISKRYNFNYIFKEVNARIEPGNPLVILGPNGSGKSTLLGIISGHIPASGGKISWELNGGSLEDSLVYQQISLAAPYLELIEDFTLEEQIRFHFQLKPSAEGLKLPEIVRLSGLEKARHRKIHYFSSGMKQRLKLVLAILSDVPLLLLDEPLSNLDASGADWYAGLIKRFGSSKSIVVCSNHQEKEHFFCTQSIQISDYQK
ncbi:MAG: ATP-binding cassette domain-containing protein [Bacteroidia bacterium]